MFCVIGYEQLFSRQIMNDSVKIFRDYHKTFRNELIKDK